jgi:hypothetical protein|uniref:Cathepsin propeptide inhibitor domain-containing protein n=1 Tax=Zea mays TaxID=4577 RepID=A0A804PLS7_MAIZE
MEPKLAVAVFVLFLAFAACSANHHRDPSVVGYSQEDLALPSSLFRSWSVKHGKLYASPTEKLERYEIFKQNLMHIAETNRKNGSYWLGLNQFADVAHEEFKASYLGLKRALPRAGAPQTRTPTAFRYAAAAAGSLPWSVDWRYKGAVTPVKNQGKCGEFRLWTIHERHPLLSVLLCRLDATRRWEMRLQGEQKKNACRELLGLLVGGSSRRDQPDRDGQAGVALGAGAGGLRHHAGSRLRRGDHGLGVRLHDGEPGDPRRGRLPVPHGRRLLQRETGSHTKIFTCELDDTRTQGSNPLLWRACLAPS